MDNGSQDSGSLEALHSFFSSIMPLHDSDRELVDRSFVPFSFKRRQQVLAEGQRAEYYYFVVSGCLRQYSSDAEGNIHILKFATEGQWITDIDSFYHLKPSCLNIDTLEPSVLLGITLERLVRLYVEAPRFDRVFRILSENELAALQRRHLETISLSADERYQSFAENYPGLMNRISQAQIAAYLGVTPEFLSRMRKKNLFKDAEKH